jgi:hypothetical protein
MAEVDLSMLSTRDHGYTVDDEDDDDPVLLDRDGRSAPNSGGPRSAIRNIVVGGCGCVVAVGSRPW